MKLRRWKREKERRLALAWKWVVRQQHKKKRRRAVKVLYGTSRAPVRACHASEASGRGGVGLCDCWHVAVEKGGPSKR